MWEPSGSFQALRGRCHLCCVIQTEWAVCHLSHVRRKDKQRPVKTWLVPTAQWTFLQNCPPLTNLQHVDWTLNKHSNSCQLAQVMCLLTSPEKQKWKSVVWLVRWGPPTTAQRRLPLLFIDMSCKAGVIWKTVTGPNDSPKKPANSLQWQTGV